MSAISNTAEHASQQSSPKLVQTDGDPQASNHPISFEYQFAISIMHLGHGIAHRNALSMFPKISIEHTVDNFTLSMVPRVSIEHTLDNRRSNGNCFDNRREGHSVDVCFVSDNRLGGESIEIFSIHGR